MTSRESLSSPVKLVWATRPDPASHRRLTRLLFGTEDRPFPGTRETPARSVAIADEADKRGDRE